LLQRACVCSQGHLATSKATNGLLLREAAQCPDEDEKAFQDTSKYKYFNTNNLWVDLQKLKETMDKNDGVLPLPVIKNGKTVDPRDKKCGSAAQNARAWALAAHRSPHRSPLTSRAFDACRGQVD
jgi:UTP--glucose-1-phosphate uridylyltransferase